MRKEIKTVLVTGCAGFIGGNLTRELTSRLPEIRIIGLDDLSTGKKENIQKNIEFIHGSITDKVLVEKIFKNNKIDCVFHLAALPRVGFSIKEPEVSDLVNLHGTVVLLEQASKNNVKKFIFSSSSSVYGIKNRLPNKETDRPCPISPYAMQKYGGELYCQLFSKLYGIETVILRYFTVFGPGQYGDSPYATVISAWLEGLYFPNKKSLFIEGDGSQSRDFCYIDNVIEANILAMLSSASLKGEIFNIAHGESRSLIEISRMIEKMSGKKLILEKRSERTGDVKSTLADIEKSKKMLGYMVGTSFETGLTETIEWFKGR